jgi:hypothetical protein
LVPARLYLRYVLGQEIWKGDITKKFVAHIPVARSSTEDAAESKRTEVLNFRVQLRTALLMTSSPVLSSFRTFDGIGVGTPFDAQFSLGIHKIHSET